MIRNGDEVSSSPPASTTRPLRLRTQFVLGQIRVIGRIAPGPFLFKSHQHAATGVSLSDHVGGLVGGEQTGGDADRRSLATSSAVYMVPSVMVAVCLTDELHLMGALARVDIGSPAGASSKLGHLVGRGPADQIMRDALSYR